MVRAASDNRLNLRAKVFVAASVAYVLIALLQPSRHFLPGQWVGDAGPIPFLSLFLTAILIGLVPLFFLFYKRRTLAGILLIAIYSIVCMTPLEQFHYVRVRAELPHYKQAVAGAPFGDQHEEVVRGRRLVYWRWMSGDIDNAVGVLYDPDDRFDMDDETDRTAFHSITHGIVFRVEKIEPRWFYIVHS